MLPGFRFLGNWLWRLVSLALMSVTAFGIHKSVLRRGIVFVLLTMALGGVVTVLGSGGFWGLIAAAGCLCLLCVLGFRGRIGGDTYVPVELSYGGRKLQLTALRDTGNTLRDPVTGRPVLVVNSEAAQVLTGLSQQQLRSPVESIGAIPGLRLIPYRAVGCESGMLLALKIPQVKIGSWKGSGLVAFAPEGLSSDGEYQALTGGTA